MHFLGLVTASLTRTLLAAIAVTALAIAVGVRFFGLSIAGALSLYFVIWWTLLFAMLPFGVRSQAEHGDIAEGTEPGAPTLPRLREKAIWTSAAAGIVLLVTAWILPLAGL